MKNIIKPSFRNNDLLTQNIADEFLIYDMTVNKAYSLNKTSSTIWQLCDGSRTIIEVAEEAGKKLDSKVSEDLIAMAVDQFRQSELLADNGIELPQLSGISRRQIIRKVGLASAVALPLISALVVPTAADAQSRTACLTNGAPCDPRIVPTLCCNNCRYQSGTPSFVCNN